MFPKVRTVHICPSIAASTNYIYKSPERLAMFVPLYFCDSYVPKATVMFSFPLCSCTLNTQETARSSSCFLLGLCSHGFIFRLSNLRLLTYPRDTAIIETGTRLPHVFQKKTG